MNAPRPPSGTVPDPPPKLECNFHPIPAGLVIHRIHDQRFAADEFNPGFGKSRFAPLEATDGRTVPTAYGATSLECAIHETIFHDIGGPAEFKSVSWTEIDRLSYSTLCTRTEMNLVALFAADLLKWGIERRNLIDTPRRTYGRTRRWAEAIHAQAPEAAGLVWVSRRYDQAYGLMLFGDRIGQDGLEPRSSTRLTADPGSLQCLHNLARRSGILIAR